MPPKSFILVVMVVHPFKNVPLRGWNAEDSVPYGALKEHDKLKFEIFGKRKRHLLLAGAFVYAIADLTDQPAPAEREPCLPSPGP